ncbi:glycosyltransferase family 4 protein [Microbacterium sp. YY-01]|uniref:glycosyltransferase family 4 protein n=1 Tax=Microbacterium sp. YY-01 TaxID=3421634 RepID=UPI003D179310
MHIVFFGDQHPDSLGGAQVSMRLQKKYLERAGHTVTIVAPRMHSSRMLPADAAVPASDVVALPSVAITRDREYSFTWPGRRTDVFIDMEFARRKPVDVVHVQADFWGALAGYRFAHRHGLPVVHTMHNRVDVGLAAVTRLHRPALAVLNAWRRWALRERGRQPTGTDGWAYLRGLAAGAMAVTAPSGHFARRLERHSVYESVDVVWNGIDDELVDSLLENRPARDPAQRPRLLWIGRMSPEKRLLPFLEAVVEAGIDADIDVVGSGGQMQAAQRIAQRAQGSSIRFLGPEPYRAVLQRIQRADAVVQTSVGFETQGMTPFEAAALGTPSIVCDPDIAAELGGGLWQVPDATQLAATLRRAVNDIAAAVAPSPLAAVGENFRQSSRTAAMLAVYERVLGR